MNRPSAWAMWALASFFYAYQCALRVAPSVLMNDITTQFSFDATMMGQFSGGYYLGYSLIHIPVGILLDRFGPKRILPIFILLVVAGMSPLIWSEFWAFGIAGRALVGIGSSAAILGVFKVIRMAFAKNQFTWMLSLSVTIGLIGSMNGAGPLNALNKLIGFQSVIITLMALGVILSAITFFSLPKTDASSQSDNVLKDIVSVLKNKTVLVICFLAGLMVGPLEGFADVWGSTFLQIVYGMEASTAASLPSTIFLGMCVGGPILSLVARKINDIRTIIGCGALMGMAFWALLMKWIPEAALPFVFFAVGVACAYQIIAIAHASTRVSESQMGLTSAIANMIIMTFGYVFHAAIGGAIGLASQGEISMQALTTEALITGLLVIPVALAIASAGYFILSLREAR
jgi:predicted MFS family arabinose efflux permease